MLTVTVMYYIYHFFEQLNCYLKAKCIPKPIKGVVSNNDIYLETEEPILSIDNGMFI